MMTDEVKDVTVRLLVPVAVAGGLIGKGGAIIKQFRQESGAWIDIGAPIPYATDRVLTAKGLQEKVAAAITAVATQLEELSKDEFKIVFVIPNSQVGCIIGRGGATIKAIREESSAELKLSDQPLPGSTDKILVIKGQPSAVKNAISKTVSQLSTWNGQSKQKEVPYLSKPPIDDGISFAPLNRGVPSYPLAMPYSQPQPMYGYGGHPYGVPDMGNHQITTLIPIEEQHVGTVIGKGGCNIQEIRLSSGATVKMADKSEADPSALRNITITGTKVQNEIAMHMVFKKIESYDPNFQKSLKERRQAQC
mmetsp:Transcript_43885/g.85852  ORF Transcript_43885/g.85852 Transcript_43885/m.85852 type:complete len:307 (+) Transcript_43885:22-942(+)